MANQEDESHHCCLCEFLDIGTDVPWWFLPFIFIGIFIVIVINFWIWR